jgi:hypothetical protein
MVIINEICQMSITSPPGRRLRDSPPDELREKDTPAIIVCEKFPERFELLKDCEKKTKRKTIFNIPRRRELVIHEWRPLGRTARASNPREN